MSTSTLPFNYAHQENFIPYNWIHIYNKKGWHLYNLSYYPKGLVILRQEHDCCSYNESLAVTRASPKSYRINLIISLSPTPAHTKSIFSRIDPPTTPPPPFLPLCSRLQWSALLKEEQETQKRRNFSLRGPWERSGKGKSAIFCSNFSSKIANHLVLWSSSPLIASDRSVVYYLLIGSWEVIRQAGHTTSSKNAPGGAGGGVGVLL